jgi:hypothetical protein
MENARRIIVHLKQEGETEWEEGEEEGEVELV